MRHKRLGSTALALVMAALFCVAWAGKAYAKPSFSVGPSGPKPMSVPQNPKCLNDLIEGSLAYDGRTITVEGEAVGEVLNRGTYSWVNISDGTATIGVWGPTSLIGQVKKAGRYKTYGDIVRVTGIFRRDDARQGGELDIQATSLEIVKHGRGREHPITSRRLLRTCLSLILALALGIVWYQTKPAKATKPS